jgi:hypothetical protein
MGMRTLTWNIVSKVQSQTINRVPVTQSLDIVKNSQVLFHDGSLLHSKFNTQLLITVHNSSRILTHVQLVPVL